MRSVSIPIAIVTLALAGCLAGTKDENDLDVDAQVEETSSSTRDDEQGVTPVGDRAVPEGAREIRLVARDYAFDPARITASPREDLALVLVNQAEHHHHAFALFLPGGGEPVVRMHQVGPGDQDMITFPAPAEPGEYRFHCPIGDHSTQGMDGVLVVTAP